MYVPRISPIRELSDHAIPLCPSAIYRQKAHVEVTMSVIGNIKGHPVLFGRESLSRLPGHALHGKGIGHEACLLVQAVKLCCDGAVNQMFELMLCLSLKYTLKQEKSRTPYLDEWSPQTLQSCI